MYVRTRDFVNWNDNGMRLIHSENGKLEYHEDFVYVPLNKIYIFHVIEKKTVDDVRHISYSHCPKICLIEGVFSSKQAAEDYAKFYMSRQEKIDKAKLEEF